MQLFRFSSQCICLEGNVSGPKHIVFRPRSPARESVRYGEPYAKVRLHEAARRCEFPAISCESNRIRDVALLQRGNDLLPRMAFFLIAVSKTMLVIHKTAQHELRFISLRALHPWDITKHGTLFMAGSGVESHPLRMTLSDVWKLISRCGMLLGRESRDCE